MPVWLYFQLQWDVCIVGLVVVPIIIGANVLLILTLTRDDVSLRRYIITGLLLKFASACVYLVISSYLWGFSVDSYGYMNVGTAVRLKVEQNQLVDVFGEIGVLIDGLKGA
jgi:hypothetical protein